jgi:hypothetical protein
MRRVRMIIDCLRKSISPRYRLIFSVLVPILLVDAATAPAADPIAVFPATPYEGYIIYESLAVFWLFIISLIVIIRMKLREIERIQQMGAEEETSDAPFLQ